MTVKLLTLCRVLGLMHRHAPWSSDVDVWIGGCNSMYTPVGKHPGFKLNASRHQEAVDRGGMRCDIGVFS